MVLILALCTSQAEFARAESQSYLQEGLTLEYEWRGVYTSYAGSSFSGTVKIRVQDRFEDMVRISYEGSFRFVFPLGIESSKIDAFNLDGTAPVLSTHGDTKERYWSFSTKVTLKDRTAIAIEGDHVDVVIARGYREGKVWSQWDCFHTDFPLSYPALVFLSPGLSSGDHVPSFRIYDTYSGRPKIREDTIPISRLQTEATPFGNRETLNSEMRNVTETGWDETVTRSWDKETGILIQIAQTDELVKDEWTYTVDYSLRLVEVQMPETPTLTTTQHSAATLATGTVIVPATSISSSIQTTQASNNSEKTFLEGYWMYIALGLTALFAVAAVVLAPRRRKHGSTAEPKPIPPISPQTVQAKPFAISPPPTAQPPPPTVHPPPPSAEAEVRYCRFCRAVIPSVVVYCTKCGRRQPGVATKP